MLLVRLLRHFRLGLEAAIEPETALYVCNMRLKQLRLPLLEVHSAAEKHSRGFGWSVVPQRVTDNTKEMN